MEIELIQIIILLFSLFALSRVFLNIKNNNLERLESIFWVLFWVVAIFATALPAVLVNVANLLGVERGVDLVIYGSIVILAYMIFRLYAQITNMERKITKIVRTVAIKNEKRT
jgi:small membrane protein